MDTLGALALGTELPTAALLSRKPYKRNSSLISRPMLRNILCQGALQIAILLALLYSGSRFFNISDRSFCARYEEKSGCNDRWDPVSREVVPSSYNPAYGTIGCSDFNTYCGEIYCNVVVILADYNKCVQRDKVRDVSIRFVSFQPITSHPTRIRLCF